MINPVEIRWGNQLLFKDGIRITTVACTGPHFALFARGELALFFPVVLKADLLLKYGFVENKEYALYPQAREFKRTLVVKAKARHELIAYVKSNGECLAWAQVDATPASNQVFQLHQLQNLHYALTGAEL